MTVALSTGETIYLSAWLLALLLSVALVARRSADRIWPTDLRYVRFLAEPWKVVAFAISATLVTGAAPYSGDPTWDHVDGALISAVVYWMSPWALGTLVREMRGPRRGDVLFVGVCGLLLPCWVYDGYILLRDHMYPSTWASNLIVSGPICILAGLFWNLGASPDARSSFAFLWNDWPPTHRTPLRRVLPLAMILSLPLVVAVLAFVVLYYTDR